MSYSKFRAKRVSVDGITFHSKAEARRYGELKLLERAGQISNLELQPRFDLVVNGKRAALYYGDFRYVENGKSVTEDVKSEPTRTSYYRLKIRLLKILYPDLDHREIT